MRFGKVRLRLDGFFKVDQSRGVFLFVHESNSLIVNRRGIDGGVCRLAGRLRNGLATHSESS